MIKTLRLVGKSPGLRIDRPILAMLGIDRRTPLRLRSDGRILDIEPIVPDGSRGDGAVTGQQGSAGAMDHHRETIGAACSEVVWNQGDRLEGTGFGSSDEFDEIQIGYNSIPWYEWEINDGRATATRVLLRR